MQFKTMMATAKTKAVAATAALAMVVTGGFAVAAPAQAAPSPAVPIVSGELAPPVLPKTPGKTLKGFQGSKGHPGGTASGVQSRALLAGPFYTYGVARQVLTGTDSASGFAANLTINDPAVCSVDGANAHSISEIAVQSPDGQQVVEAGWRKAVGGTPTLFVGHWINGVFQGYNTGFTLYGTPVNPPGTSLASMVTSPQSSKRFQISYSSGVWWVAFDGAYIGYFNGTRWTSAGVTTFNKGNIFQGYWEVASTVNATPKTDMGNGQLASSGTSARIGSINLTSPSTGVVTNFTASVIPSTTPTTAATVSSLSVDTMRGGGPLYAGTGTPVGC